MIDNHDLDDSAVEADATPSQSESSSVDRVYKPDEVTKIVTRERDRAYKKGHKEALMQMQEQAPEAQASAGDGQQPAAQQPQQAQQAQAQQFAGMSPEQIRQMIAEETPKILQNEVKQRQTEQLIGAFSNKIQAANAKYPDLEQKIMSFDLNHGAGVLALANDMDNTADIMAELTDNPEKWVQIQDMLKSQPRKAMEKMVALSTSIKQNQDAAASNKTANQPFNQVTPSQKASVDNGPMSVSDFRSMFKNKR